MDPFGAALVFHGMVVFVQEGRFRQLLAKTCAALFLGWRVYALILPFIALGLGGEAIALLRAAVSSNEKAGIHRARARRQSRSFAADTPLSPRRSRARQDHNGGLLRHSRDGGEKARHRLPAPLPYAARPHEEELLHVGDLLGRRRGRGRLRPSRRGFHDQTLSVRELEPSHAGQSLRLPVRKRVSAGICAARSGGCSNRPSRRRARLGTSISKTARSAT